MKPLTIEELKRLEVVDWVWIKDIEDEREGFYYQLDYSDKTNFGIYEYFNYGKTWQAWKNKEQAEGFYDKLQTECDDKERYTIELYNRAKDAERKLEQVRKDTAKEILERLIRTYNDIPPIVSVLKVIAREYGVEVDE